MVVPSLSWLMNYFEILKQLGIKYDTVKPWDNTSDGCAAYAAIVEKWIGLVGERYNTPFKSWRKGALTANHIRLTPACQRAWQILEGTADNDFIVVPAHTGSLYAGYSVRASRVQIVMSANQFPQDCILVGGTLMVQPDRLKAGKVLDIDCPGNQYSPAADGRFAYSVYFYWLVDMLDLYYYWADCAHYYFGSAGGWLR